MSEQRKPRKRDKVLVSFEAEVLDFDDHGLVGLVGGTYGSREWRSYIPETATVEVLERADGIPDEAWEAASAVYTTAGRGFEDIARDAIRAAFAAAGGGPAAEAEKPAPRKLSMANEQRVGELLARGQHADAVTLVSTLWAPHAEAEAYVKSTPAYQTYLNHRQVEDVALPPLHADNAAIVTGRYPAVSGADVPDPQLDNEGIETGLYFAEKAQRRAAGEVV